MKRIGQIVAGIGLVLIGFAWLLVRQLTPLSGLFGSDGTVEWLALAVVWLFLLAGGALLTRGIFSRVAARDKRGSPDASA